MKAITVLFMTLIALSALAKDMPMPSKVCFKNVQKVAETLEKLNSPNEPLYRQSTIFSNKRWNDRSHNSIGYGGSIDSGNTSTISPVFMKENGEAVQYNFDGKFDEEICKIDTVKRIVIK